MAKRNVLAVFLFAICLTTVFVMGCRKKAEENVSQDIENDDVTTITFGVFETDNITEKVWQDMIEAFEEDYPGIKVEKIIAKGDDRPAFWRILLSSGSFPDVVIEAEQLATMEGIFAEVPLEIQALFEESDLCEYNGKCVTIPSFKQYKMQCFYNKKEFQDLNLKEPQTWEEFIHTCRIIKEAGKIPLMCGGMRDIWATGEPFWIAEGDTALLSEYPEFNRELKEGRNRWNNEITIKVLENWQKMIEQDYYYGGAMSLSYGQAAEELKNGTAVMMIDGSWQASTLDREDNQEIGVFAVPAMNENRLIVADCSYWGVSASSKNKDAAFAFVKYVFDENQSVYREYLRSDGLFSTTKKAVSYEQGPVMKKFMDNIDGWDTIPEIVKIPGEYAVPSGMQLFMDRSFQKIFQGADVRGEVESWDEEYQRLLER